MRICELQGTEPDPKRMPPNPAEFPVEVQPAFFVFDYLEDRFEGMSGTYMGKNWNNLEFLFKLFKVEDQKTVLFFMKMYEGILINYRIKKMQEKQKAEERRNKASSGCKQYSHNVKL